MDCYECELWNHGLVGLWTNVGLWTGENVVLLECGLVKMCLSVGLWSRVTVDRYECLPTDMLNVKLHSIIF